MLSLIFVSCNASNADTKPKAQPVKSTLSTEAQQALEGVFSSYEKLRALLASDKTEGISKEAEVLKAASQDAAAKAPTLNAQLGAFSNAAEQLKTASGKLEDARRVFGELSKGVVALVSTEPSLQSGRYVFECSMAVGYQKWVQTSTQISNPYMGAKMLACGMASTW